MTVISAVYHNHLIAIYLSDYWKFLRIKLYEIEFQSDFSKFLFNSYILYKIFRIRLLRLNAGVIPTINTVFLHRNSRKF